MSKPTVTVVVKRIRSLLEEQSEILKEVEDQVHDLLLKIEDLASYLEELGEEKDEERFHIETDDESEDEIPNFILKVGSESRVNRKSLQRFLTELAYKSEDVIDNIIYKNKYEVISCSFLKSNICKPCCRSEPREMLRIDSIVTRLEKAQKDIKALYSLGTTKPGQNEKLRSQDERLRQGLPPAPNTNPRLVGIRKDVDTLVGKLTKKGNYANVLYMVGREGSGKTTMASEISNHPAIKEHFTSLVWADASELRDAKQILLEIIKQTQGKEVQHRTESTKELANILSNITEQRPYLIILDDVENPEALATHMLPMIQNSKNSSKIVIITRFLPHHPYKHEEHVVGSDEDVDSLAETLIRKDTTSIFHTPQKQATLLLLEELYVNPIVRQHFDFRRWVHIEDGADTKTVMLKVLEEITNNKSLAKETIDTLKEKLQAGLRLKKYLIVLDQVEEAQRLVDIFHPILAAAEHKSKLLLVTNNPPSQLQNSDITGEELLDANRLARRLTGEGDQPLLFSIIDLDNSGHKTDLARKLYDHPAVNQHFDAKVWITISKDWDGHAALCHIIRQITGKDPQVELPSTEKLAKLLLSTLAQKMYLLVLDDIGDAEDLVFELLAESSRTSHQRRDTHKSKVIITVDNPRTIQSSMKSILYVVRPLTVDESWELLCSIAVNHAANSSNTQQIISKFDREWPENWFQKYQVLAKCKGIPLAVVALGGLLSTKGTVEEWKYVFTCLREVETPLHEVLDDILLLCYDELPADIMPCFMYLALFPKHPDIPAGVLVRMLIAEGLVTLNPPLITGQTMEDMATNYLEELARRCMIEVVRRNHIGQIKYIRLHDQIHQLSIKKSAELGFLQKYPFKEMTEKPLQRAGIRHWEYELHTREMLLRRTTIHHGEHITYPTKSSNLRSFVQFGKHGVSGKFYYFQHDTSNLRLEPIHEHFKLLRVLNLSGIRTSNGTLPKSIGYLIFLTYLGLRATNIKLLPDTMGNLKKLVTLDYRGTLEPINCAPLPDILSQMTELRNLFLPQCAISSTKTSDLSLLRNLQTLWGVTGGDWITKDFVNLGPSLVKVGIVRISSRIELEAILYWLTIRSKQLRILKLDWHTADRGRLQFPENLHNFQALHKLALIGRLKEEYDFTLLPSLVKLELFFSHLEKSDPTTKLGSLPHLKILILWNSYKGSQWTCGSGSFPKLEELQVSHLTNLEEWIVQEGALPKLKQLSIFHCRKLNGLPDGLSYLNLQKLEILDMPKPFCNRLQERMHKSTAEGNPLHTIPSIPYINFEASQD